MYRLSAICHSALAGGRPRIPAASQALPGDPKWRDPAALGMAGAARIPGGRRLPPPVHVCGYKYVYVPGGCCPPDHRASLQDPRVGVAPIPPHPPRLLRTRTRAGSVTRVSPAAPAFLEGRRGTPGAPAAGTEAGLEPGCPGSRSVPGSGCFPMGITAPL